MRSVKFLEVVDLTMGYKLKIKVRLCLKYWGFKIIVESRNYI
jgi:hypothetical protein